jgi:hypothetical protein
MKIDKTKQVSSSVVKLGKNDVELRFPFPAVDRINREHGINLMRPITYINFEPHVGATLVWGGQLHTKKPLTREQVLKLMPTDTELYGDMMGAVLFAINRALDAKQA